MDTHQQASFVLSEKAHPASLQVTPAVKTQKLHMIGNAHIDPVWLWRWQEGFHEVKATFRSALDRMKEYPQFVFISSSAAFYEWLENSDPGMFAEIQARVKEGRWGIVGGWWVQPDCNIPNGESFVRQGLYAQRYFQEKFGVIAHAGYNVDSFGHHGMLPQILKISGMDSYVFMRPMPHEKGLPGRLFWWEADDGARVLAYRIPYEYCTWGKDLEKHIELCAAELRQTDDELMCFYGVGNHGGGPTRENLDSILRISQEPTSRSQLIFSSPDQYFQKMRDSSQDFPVVHDELQHHASGCYAAHSGIKQWNRQAENILLAAERLSSVANQVTGQPYPADFSRAWKNVLFNQFHDILAGTSIEAAYEDARVQYGEAISIGERALNYAVQSIAWNIHIPFEENVRPVVVFNPHAFPVRTCVEAECSGAHSIERLVDPDGNEIPVQRVRSAAAVVGKFAVSFVADLPSLGYKVYRLQTGVPTDTKMTLSAGSTWMENGRFRFEINPETGCIRSIWDLRHHLEVLAGEGARPVVLADESDTWGHSVFKFDQAIGQFTPTCIRLIENGPVRATLRVESAYASSRLVQEFCLYADLDTIDVKVSVDWHERHKMLKLRFPVNLNQMKPTYEIPYGSLVRGATGDEEPGQTWIDLSGISRDTGDRYGLSLTNNAKYSYDVTIRDIGLTVLRSPIYAHHTPFVPDAETEYAYIDQGQQTFRYSLIPHPGSWEEAGTVQQAAGLNQGPAVLAATFHPEGALPQAASYFEVFPGTIHVTVLKKAEENDDLIIRAFETTHTRTHADFILTGWGREFSANFGPGEIKTFRVAREPSSPVVETNGLEWQA